MLRPLRLLRPTVERRKYVLSFGSTRRSCSVARLRLRKCSKCATSFDNSCVLLRLRLLLHLLRRLLLLLLRLLRLLPWGRLQCPRSL